ncbi:hypothetical protein D3C87_1722440 [compost metagenome]
MFWLKVSFSSWRKVEKIGELSSNARLRVELTGGLGSTLDNKLTPDACKCR